ncbi:MAG: CsiV family protein [Xanthomonadales bacterium]|nr:CsiV family protein [Xanthomonadales bacterium]
MNKIYISLRYITFLIISIVCADPSSLWAQESRYRVEILVLSHLSHDEKALEVSWPTDYSAAIDFLTPPEPEPEEESEPEEERGENDVPEAKEDPDAGTTDDLEIMQPEDPEQAEETQFSGPVQVEEMSETMQEAWRRLRLSGPFRPLQFLAWEQSAAAPFPALRIHDSEILLLDDPYADVRAERAAEAALAPGYASDREPDFGPDSEGINTPDAADALPPPTVYYRLDGSVKLRKTRFVHLDLDIELREAIFGEAREATPEAFRVYRLQQSRQIKTGKMSYFDGPVFGLLAYLTSVETETEKEVPAQLP